MKHKALLINLKHAVGQPVRKDNVAEITMKALADSGCETELIVCRGSTERRFLLANIDLDVNHTMIIIVWEWLFDIDDIEMFTRALRRKFKHLLMVALSDDQRCVEILKQTGCIDNIEGMVKTLSHSQK